MGDNNYLSRCVMSRTCQVTGKRVMSGNNVSHANNKTRRRFLPNLHERRFWVASENRWVKLRVSAAAMRTIDKHGIDVVLADLRARGERSEEHTSEIQPLMRISYAVFCLKKKTNQSNIVSHHILE